MRAGVAAAEYCVTLGMVAAFMASWNLLLGVVLVTVGRTRAGVVVAVAMLTSCIVWIVAWIAALT